MESLQTTCSSCGAVYNWQKEPHRLTPVPNCPKCGHDPNPKRNVSSDALPGHGARVVALRFSADGSKLASGGWSQEIKLWDCQTRSEVLSLDGHTGNIFELIFSNNGKLLVSAATDSTIRVWDLTSGKEKKKIEYETGITAIALSEKGGILACATKYPDSKVLLLKRMKVAMTLSVPADSKGSVSSVEKLAFSPDGRFIAGGLHSGILAIWDVTSGKLCSSLDFEEPEEWTRVRCVGVCYSPDARLIATLYTDNVMSNAKLILRDADNIAVARWEKDVADACTVKYSPDGVQIATGGHNQIHLWDTEKGKRRALKGKHCDVCDVAFTPDGQLLASTGEGLSINLWPVERKSLLKKLIGR